MARMEMDYNTFSGCFYYLRIKGVYVTLCVAILLCITFFMNSEPTHVNEILSKGWNLT